MFEIKSSLIKHSETIVSQTESLEPRISVQKGYYWYQEYDTKKIIYVFGEHKFTEINRYYYYDFSEKTIRSFTDKNTVFVARTEKVSDQDTVKMYDQLLVKEIGMMGDRYQTLLQKLADSLK